MSRSIEAPSILWHCNVWPVRALHQLVATLPLGADISVVSWDCDDGAGGRLQHFQLCEWKGRVVRTATSEDPTVDVRIASIAGLTVQFPEPDPDLFAVVSVQVKQRSPGNPPSSASPPRMILDGSSTRCWPPVRLKAAWRRALAWR